MFSLNVRILSGLYFSLPLIASLLSATCIQHEGCGQHWLKNTGFPFGSTFQHADLMSRTGIFLNGHLNLT